MTLPTQLIEQYSFFNHDSTASSGGKKSFSPLPFPPEDNIRGWTGLEFAKSQTAVQNGEKWGKLVAKSSVLPKRPSLLKGIDEMREKIFHTAARLKAELFW